MDKEELRERYEASGDERFYEQAEPLYREAVRYSPGDAGLLRDYGYLLECHARYTLRSAAQWYQRAIDAAPHEEKSHFQLFMALSALGDLDTVIPRYEQQVAAAPGEPSGYRLLAAAYLRAGDFDKAAGTVRDGLRITPDDPALTEFLGEVYAATGNPEEALASWRQAFARATEDYGISMRFSAAFLLERLGRFAEAAGEWRFIVGWMEERGDTIHLDWPRRELRRLETRLANG